MDDRLLPLEGIRNFRDYGGYVGADGRPVQRGMLWRSGHHCEATPGDLERVHALGLATVFDLRGDSERALYPCLRHREFAAEVRFEPGETAGLSGAAAHEAAGQGVRTGEEARQAMIRLNEGMPWRPVLMATLKLHFAELAAPVGPSLLHCVAGKDRTGLACALTHHVLGVHPDDAMADYLLTHAAIDVDERVRVNGEALRERYGAEMDDAAVRALISVAPEYLGTALAAIRQRHGTLDAYLGEVLGVGAAEASAIRAALLE